MQVQVERITWQQAMPIRHKVLWPSKPIEFCKLDNDERAWHFGGVYDGQIVSCASIFITGKKAQLRKFATLEQYQGLGIGRQLITAVLVDLNRAGIEHFWCDARESALNFYHRIGMTKSGERFYKSDVPYFKMTMNLKGSE